MTLTIALCIVILCLSVFCCVTFAYYLKARRDRDRWVSIANKRSDTLYEKLGEIEELNKRHASDVAFADARQKDIERVEQRLGATTAAFNREADKVRKCKEYLAAAKADYEKRKKHHESMASMIEDYNRIIKQLDENYKPEEANI